MENEIAIGVDAPAEASGHARVVPPFTGSVLTGLVITCPAASYPAGPATLRLSVDGLAESKIYVPLEIEVRDGQPPRVGAVERFPGLEAALTAVRTQFVGFHCFGESNEWSDSDEPYFIFGTLTTARREKRTEKSGIFEDVDAGQTRGFEVEVFSGRAASMVISVTVMENDADGMDPEAVKEIVDGAYDKASDKFVELVAEMPFIGGPVQAAAAMVALLILKPAVTKEINEVLAPGDDLVNTEVIALTPQELRSYLAEPAQDFYGIKAHFASPVITSHGEGAYVALFRVLAP